MFILRARSSPFFCVLAGRALFRVRAGSAAGWGPWSPSSDAFEAQEIILPIKKGATRMLLRWFNKPEGDVLKWELSRRVREQENKYIYIYLWSFVLGSVVAV